MPSRPQAGAVVPHEPAAPDLAWLDRHSWAWDPARLDELIREAEPHTLYVYGGADNQQELPGRFTQCSCVHLPGLKGGRCLVDPADVASHVRAFAQLRLSALSPGKSIQMLLDMAS